MMSITPTAIIRSASPRPYAEAPGAQLSVSVGTGSLGVAPFGGNWVCCDHMSTTHNPTIESKRLDPGSFAGVLT